jgi:SAM-dependent methyltransferase
MTDDALPEHVAANRDYWDGTAARWVSPGERSWGAPEPYWGIWGIPESQLRMLPDDMAGLDAIELGCGTAYVGSWMARRGARVVGIDNSEQQLGTARRLAMDHGVELTLLHGNAETVPYKDASFDFAISECGAAIWCDPHAWIPEAHRLLRPGGSLVFLGSTPLTVLCSPLDGSIPCTERLERDYPARPPPAAPDGVGLRPTVPSTGSSGSTGATPPTSRAASSSTCRSPGGSACSGRPASRWSTTSRSRHRSPGRRSTSR